MKNIYESLDAGEMYERLSMEVITFTVEDIVTTSPPSQGGDEYGGQI